MGFLLSERDLGLEQVMSVVIGLGLCVVLWFGCAVAQPEPVVHLRADRCVSAPEGWTWRLVRDVDQTVWVPNDCDCCLPPTDLFWDHDEDEPFWTPDIMLK